MNCIHLIQADDIQGQPVSLSKYRGSVVLIVNLASRCGFTPQYESLQTLHKRYKNQGLKILGFPCNDFMDQEPGTEAEIRKFCESRYQVDFDLFAKVHILGADCHPLYRVLQEANLSPEASGGIKSFGFKIFRSAWFRFVRKEPLRQCGVQWNFHKFLVNREGIPIAHYSSTTDPLDSILTTKIEQCLGA